jgi:antitoxin PrlF
MDLAKVMAKGQVTIPISVRKKLNLKEGDKVVFMEKDGVIIIANSTSVALQGIQKAFQGEAERLGLSTDQDVVNMVKEIRRDIHAERKEP